MSNCGSTPAPEAEEYWHIKLDDVLADLTLRVSKLEEVLTLVQQHLVHYDATTEQVKELWSAVKGLQSLPQTRRKGPGASAGRVWEVEFLRDTLTSYTSEGVALYNAPTANAAMRLWMQDVDLSPQYPAQYREENNGTRLYVVDAPGRKGTLCVYTND